MAHAEGLFNLNPISWLLILDTPEHVDSELIFKIGCRSSLYQLFSKRDF
jgi:hypothetical protein